MGVNVAQPFYSLAGQVFLSVNLSLIYFLRIYSKKKGRNCAVESEMKSRP